MFIPENPRKIPVKFPKIDIIVAVCPLNELLAGGFLHFLRINNYEAILPLATHKPLTRDYCYYQKIQIAKKSAKKIPFEVWTKDRE